MKNKTNYIAAIILIALLFTGCAESIDYSNESMTNDRYGFLGGLWHGIIVPISFLISLFRDDVAIYAINNNGAFYDLGFVIGLGALTGGSSKTR